MSRKYKMVKKRVVSFTMAILMPLAGLLLPTAAAETPDIVFTGDPNAAAIIKNLDYYDVKNSTTWAKSAIYEASALGAIKGLANMNLRFGRTDTLSKEEALAVAYRAAGREAEAQALGETLNTARTAAGKKTDPLAIWYDGYLQLASNEGLITQQNLTDALTSDQSTLTAGSFKRKAPAQRQEIGFWFAKTLNLQPVRGQQNIFNNYTDWRSADPDKIPYIEAILENGIMNGNGGGRFNPAQSVTREQTAQIVKNAESQMLAVLKYVKNTGTIESISPTGDYSNGSSVSGKNIDLRNANGKLHRISVSNLPAGSSAGKNEQSGAATASKSKELVVYRNGTIGNSSLLKKGDRLEYITSSTDNTVKYVNVISNVNDVTYVAAQVVGIDGANLLIKVNQLFKMDYPDLEKLNQNISLNADSTPNITYRYSKNVIATINGSMGAMADITPGSTVILTINSGKIVTAVHSTDLGINSEEQYIVNGIVEENNPALGYLTLYNEDGTGTANASANSLTALRTYNYVNQNNLEVFRNHEKAGIDDIQTGDTAYLKLDENGSIESVSAVQNYTVKYGKIISKLPGGILVAFDDGPQMTLNVGSNVLVIQDKKLTDYNALRDGDRVRLILNMTNKAADLKEITIEGNEHLVTNIYKGTVTHIDTTSDKINVLNLQVFKNGNWERTDKKGFTAIPFAGNYTIYSGDRKLSIADANKLRHDNDAYIAVESDYGGDEKAVVLSYRNSSDTEVPYNDSITGTVSGSANFNLTSENKQIGFDAGSIIVKNGRLVSGNSLANNDLADMAVNRNSSSGDLKAGVVKVNESQNTGYALYRGRINKINENSDFTLESFSQLNGTDWNYYNTPKTFKLNFNTRLLADDGVMSIRDFTDYGTGSYTDRTVYVLADGTDAVIISTAPYGAVNVKGTVYSVTGAQIGGEGTQLSEPNTIVIRKVKVYNTTSYTWTDASDMTLNILGNSIILKGGKVINPSDIQKGDSISVIRKDAASPGDAYIITVVQ